MVVCCVCYHRVPNMSQAFRFRVLLLRKKERERQGRWDIPSSLFVVCIKYNIIILTFPSAIETERLVLSLALSLASVNGDRESSVFQTFLISDAF